ncbi:hypothetical protein ACLBOM_16580 [Escherichia coli]
MKKLHVFSDQIQAVRRVTEKQFVSNTGDDLDVIGVAFDAGMACVHVLFIRQGKVLGSRSYFPKVPGGTELSEVVRTFVGQFYLQGSQMRTLPGEILLDLILAIKRCSPIPFQNWRHQRLISAETKPRGDRARYLKLARTNAATALTSKLSQQSTVHQRLTALASVLKLPEVKRMECFDISHTMGEQTVASCVVFDAAPLRAEYRRYNITGITPGDDYAAMNQVLRRRYGKAIDDGEIPDVILIDGGKGQLAQAKNVFSRTGCLME